MKLKSITLNDKEMPASVTVELTIDEAALLYALTGFVAPLTITEALGDVRWGNAIYDISGCLSDALFNRFWEGGAEDVIERGRLSITCEDQ